MGELELELMFIIEIKFCSGCTLDLKLMLMEIIIATQLSVYVFLVYLYLWGH